MSNNEVHDAPDPVASRLRLVAPMVELRQLPARAVRRTRLLAYLLAHSSSVRRAVIARVIAATLCCCLAAWAGRTLSDAADIRASWGPQVTVLIARHDIPSGQVLKRSDTITGTRPRSLTPPNALRELPPGATTTAMVLAGEPLVRARLTDDEGPLAPAGTTAIRLELAVGAPTLQQRDQVDILGPRSEPQPTGAIPRPTPYDPADGQVAVISRSAVVLRPPTEDDPTIEVAVADEDVAPVAGAAFTGGVAVVRRSP